MVRLVLEITTSAFGFLLTSALAAWGIVEGVGIIGIDQASVIAKALSFPLLMIAGLHVSVIQKLHDLRDVDELNDAERSELRRKISRRVAAIWTWVIVIVIIGLASGAVVSPMPVFGTSAIYIAAMGAYWAIYSLFLIPLWSAEIAQFRSFIADRARDRKVREATLKAMVGDGDNEWEKIEALDAYIRPPSS